MTIDAVTDETCGTYICTAMTNEKTFVTKTEVRLSKEKSAQEIEGTGFTSKTRIFEQKRGLIIRESFKTNKKLRLRSERDSV